MLVGARHVCPTCAVRGFLRACPRCGRERVDLRDPPALRSLEAAWPLAAAWRGGQLFLSPFAIRHARRVLGVAAVMSLVVVIGSPVSALAHGAGALEAAITLAMGLVFSPLFFVLFALNTFYSAHLLRLVGFVYLGLGLILPFVGLGLAFLGRGLLLLTGWLLPRIELDEPPAESTPRRRAVLAAPLVLHRITDGWGWMARRDAWLSCEALTLEGQTLRLEHAAGLVSWAPSARALLLESTEEVVSDSALDTATVPDVLPPGSTSTATLEGAYRTAPTPAVTIPSWARAPKRNSRVRTTVIPAGRELRLRGGLVQDGALRGTPTHPLDLEIA